MTLIDANVLLYAYYPRAPQHERCRMWVEVEFASGAAVRLPWATIVAFLRISTNPPVFEKAPEAGTPDAYRNILVAQAGVTPKESDYLGETWYGPRGWWQALQPVYPIVRQGLIKAIEEAGDHLLVDSYWLPAASDGILEVIVARSAGQVTRIILTPASPPPTMMRHTNAPMWVVKRRTGNEQPGDATNNEVVESVLGDVVTWQEREFP